MALAASLAGCSALQSRAESEEPGGRENDRPAPPEGVSAPGDDRERGTRAPDTERTAGDASRGDRGEDREPQGCRALVNTAAPDGLYQHNASFRSKADYTVYDLRFGDDPLSPAVEGGPGIAVRARDDSIYALRMVPTTDTGVPAEALEARRMPDGEPEIWFENEIATSPPPMRFAFPAHISGAIHIDATIGDHIALSQQSQSRRGHSDLTTPSTRRHGAVIAAPSGERASPVSDPPGLGDLEAEGAAPSYLEPVEVEPGHDDAPRDGTPEDYSLVIDDRSDDRVSEEGEMAVALRACCGADMRYINLGPHPAARLSDGDVTRLAGREDYFTADGGTIAGPSGCPDVGWEDPTGEPLRVVIRPESGDARAVGLPEEPGRILGLYWIDEDAPFRVDDLPAWEVHDLDALAEEAVATWRRGRERAAEGEWEGAARAFDKALMLSDEVRPETLYELTADLQWARFQVLAGRGEPSRELRQLASAAASLDDVVEDHADDFSDLRGRVLYTRGRALEAAGDREGARESYERSLALRENEVVRGRLRDLPDD